MNKENKHQEYIDNKNEILFFFILTLVVLLSVMIFLFVMACIQNKGIYAVCGMGIYGAILLVSYICRGFMNIIKRLKNSVKNEVQTQMDINGVLHNRINYLERELNRCEERICELQLGLSNKSINVREAINKAKPEFEAAVVKACNDYRDELIKNIMDTRGNGWYE